MERYFPAQEIPRCCVEHVGSFTPSTDNTIPERRVRPAHICWLPRCREDLGSLGDCRCFLLNHDDKYYCNHDYNGNHFFTTWYALVLTTSRKLKPNPGQLAAYDKLLDKLKQVETAAALKDIRKDLDRRGMTPEKRELDEFKERLDKHGIKGTDRDSLVGQFQKQNQDKKDDETLKSLTKKTAADTYNEDMKKADELFQHKKIGVERPTAYRSNS